MCSLVLIITFVIFQTGSCGKAALQLRVKGAAETLTITCSSVEVTIKLVSYLCVLIVEHNAAFWLPEQRNDDSLNIV